MVAKLCRRRAQHVDADPDRQVSRIFRLLVKMQHGIIGSPHTVGVGKLDEIQVADPVPVNIQIIFSVGTDQIRNPLFGPQHTGFPVNFIPNQVRGAVVINQMVF